MDIPSCAYLLAAGVGAAFAFIELAARFSDTPLRVLGNYASILYILCNTIAALLVFSLFIAIDISISGMKIVERPYLCSALIGFLAMGILRSSFLNLKISGKNTNIGLNKTLDIMLNWAELLYDRNRSAYLIKTVAPIVAGIDYETLYRAVVPTCMSAMTLPSEEENNEINKVGKLLSSEPSLAEHVKVNQLAIKAVKIIGIDMLKESVRIYKDNKPSLDLEARNERIQKLNEFQQQILSRQKEE